MRTLQEIKKDILSDGVIDAAEVRQLSERLYADGRIDTEEAELLFELNDATSGKENAKEWNRFFIEAICDYLLGDEKSPGEIDADEEAWLKARIEGDGKVDKLERELLEELKKRAKVWSASLDAMLQ